MTKTMSSSSSRQWTPVVLVSFQDGDNEVKGFTSTLFAQLKQVGIGYFSHREDAALRKIDQARFALVVFTANYVESSRCLDELVKIILRRGVVVIPIFHGMGPAVVSKFEQDLDRLHREETDEKKKEWKRALAKVDGISGYELYRDPTGRVEWPLTQTIVERLVNEIRSLYSHKVFGPFGGSGKTPWYSDKINGIDVVYAEFVESLIFEVPDDTSDGPIATERNYKVKLREGEHITSFSGRFKTAKDGDPIRINVLTFRTNQRDLTPIDRREGEYFDVPLSSGDGKVIEFFGSLREENKIKFLTSIGARVKLLTPKKFCPVGLFGSRKGSRWDDGDQHTTVKGIKVGLDSSRNSIRSIAFQYEGVRSPWREHGSDAEWYEEFIINDGDEYLSSISGYCTYNGITSLTFLTNKKNTKIIGDGKGTHFSSPATGCKIVGFYGWRDEHLHGIGAYYKPIPNLNPIKSFGPFGRAKAWDDGKFKGVKKIYIAIADYIRHIKIVYEDSDQNDHTVIHGDCTGEFANTEEVVLRHYPREYLISISGYTQEDGSIRSLIFDSNQRRYGPFGMTEGEYFGYPSNKTRIIGFYGTWGKTLDSIGVYAESIPQDVFDRPSISFEGSGRTDWNDGKHSNVIGYRVTHVEDSKKRLKIESITFMYDNNGSLVEGSRHGGGDAGEWVMLDFPKERLTCIIGYRREEGGQTVIHDLQINIAMKTPMTYAARGGNQPEELKFSIPEKDKDRRIIGFFGKADTCLNSIGAHFQPYDD